MTMRLKDGDYLPDGSGGFLAVSGNEELLQRVLFQLTVPRGAFAILPDLGSRIYRLPQDKPSQRTVLAKQYAEEALAQEEGLDVQEVLWDEESGRLTVYMTWQGERASVSWTL